MKKIYLFIFLIWSQVSFSEIVPTKITNYQVEYNPYKVLSYGACKIDGEYHVLMTVGLAIKSRDGVNWQKYEAFKVRNVRMQGGPDLISCGENPKVFSRDYGLFYFIEGGWIKKGDPFPSANIYYEKFDREFKVYNSNDESSVKVSNLHARGWIPDAEEKYTGYVNVLNTNRNKIYRKYIGNIGLYYKTINGVTSENLIPLSVKNERSLMDYFEIDGAFYWMEYESNNLAGAKFFGRDGVSLKSNKLGFFDNVSKLGCVGVRSDLVACRTFEHGIIFLNLNERSVSMYHLILPKSFLNKKTNIVFGKNEIIFEASGPYETNDKELLLAGTITEYSYDSIVKFMSKRSN